MNDLAGWLEQGGNIYFVMLMKKELEGSQQNLSLQDSGEWVICSWEKNIFKHERYLDEYVKSFNPFWLCIELENRNNLKKINFGKHNTTVL